MGTWLRDCVDEYHRQNPGQMAAQMLFEVAAYASAPPTDAAGQSYYSYPTRHVNQYFGEDPARTYALNRPSRLRPEVVITTRPPRKNGHVGLGENAGGAIGEKAPQVTRQEEPQPGQTELSAAKNGNNAENLEPIHPYATTPDATNSTAPGPATRPLTKEPNTSRHEAAYATIAKI